MHELISYALPFEVWLEDETLINSLPQLLPYLVQCLKASSAFYFSLFWALRATHLKCILQEQSGTSLIKQSSDDYFWRLPPVPCRQHLHWWETSDYAKTLLCTSSHQKNQYRQFIVLLSSYYPLPCMHITSGQILHTTHML